MRSMQCECESCNPWTIDGFMPHLESGSDSVIREMNQCQQISLSSNDTLILHL
jgi:hypothetical protein